MGFTSAPGGVPVYEQAAEPLLSDERTAIWEDTSATPNPVWLVFVGLDGIQCRVELSPSVYETDFIEDFESLEWEGAWAGTSSDFVEDFQSWPLGPV